jgi:hypothetical protein
MNNWNNIGISNIQEFQEDRLLTEPSLELNTYHMLSGHGFNIHRISNNKRRMTHGHCHIMNSCKIVGITIHLSS